MPSVGYVATAAMVPRWEMALALVAGSDAIATCPRRLAEQQAGTLGLQLLEPPPPTFSWTLSLARRAEADEGLDWFSARLREAAARG
jgi:DNA-binding transcriptional LysR family regulator